MAINYKSAQEYEAIIKYLEDKIKGLEDKLKNLQENSVSSGLVRPCDLYPSLPTDLYPPPSFQVISKNEIINGGMEWQ